MARVQQCMCVVKKVQAEVKECARHRLAVNQHVMFPQMPAARAHDHDGALALLEWWRSNVAAEVREGCRFQPFDQVLFQMP